MNFFARFKKFFLILVFLGLVILIGYFIWRLFFMTSSTVTVPVATSTPGTIGGLPNAGGNSGMTNPDGTGTGELPTGITDGVVSPGGTGAPNQNEPSPIAIGGLTKTEVVNNAPSLDPTVSNSGTIQYYDRRDNKFYRLDQDGNRVPLSSKSFYSVEKVNWAPDKNQAILEYPDGSKTLYNFSTEKQVTLPSHWEDFSFSTDSNQIIAKSIGLDPDNRWLIVSNSDGSQAKALEEIGTQGSTVYPSWSPNNQIVALYTEGSDFNRQQVYFVGLNGENFKSTTIEGRGLRSQWSTTGDRLLYSVYNSNDNLNPRLWIVDASTDTISQNRTNLNLQTWADKCTFASNSEIYCAVPNNLPKGSGLYPELADKTEDSLYKIDLETGNQTLIAIPDGLFNISDIVVPENQNVLYFTDKFSGAIYKINLR